MQGLQLLPDSWYEDNVVTTWLNTRARAIDREAREVELATGDKLPYDCLILTAGSASRVPPIEGFGAPGTFVLRSADDALRIRAYAQLHGCMRATVAGGACSAWRPPLRSTSWGCARQWSRPPSD